MGTFGSGGEFAMSKLMHGSRGDGFSSRFNRSSFLHESDILD